MKHIVSFLLFFFIFVPQVSADVVLPGKLGSHESDTCRWDETIVSCIGKTCIQYENDPSYRYLTFIRSFGASGTVQYCKKTGVLGAKVTRIAVLAIIVVGVASYFLYRQRIGGKKLAT